MFYNIPSRHMARTESNLLGVHPDMVAVVRCALKRVPFVVTEGIRTPERQKQLMAAGATRTLNSRHLTGHAVDVAALLDGEIRWDWPLYSHIARHMKDCAAERKVALTWGGDWKTFRDGPHFELSWSKYPRIG